MQERVGCPLELKRFTDYLSCPREHAYSRTMSAWEQPELLLGVKNYKKLGADKTHYPDLTWAEEMMLTDQENLFTRRYLN